MILVKVLFVNSCIRNEDSRTYSLAKAFIEKLYKIHSKMELEEIKLADLDLKPLYYDDIKRRDELINNNAKVIEK